MAGEVTLPEVTVGGTAPAPAPAAPATGFSTAPGTVAVVRPDGGTVAVRVEDAEAAFQQGYRPASRGETVAEQMGTGGQVAAGIIGVGRGVTMGLSDVALVEGSRALGGEAEAADTRRVLSDARDAYSKTSIGGEIAGSLAGMALLPGSAGARGAVAGEGVLARAGSRFLASAPRAAMEGAAMAVGHQASEDSLGNHEANAEKYVVAAAGGAVFGGILGGGLHAVGGAVADKARTFYGAVARGGTELAEGGAYRTAAKMGEEGAAKEGSPFMSWLREKLSTGAEDQAFKATGAKIRDIQKLGATAEAQADRTRRIGRRLLDEGIVDATASQEKIAHRLTAKVRQAGEELSALRSGLDKAVERPSLATIGKRMEDEVLRPLSEMPLGEAEGRPAAEFLEAMASKGGERPSFEQLYKYRRRLDDLLERGGEYSRIPGGPSKPGAEPLRALRGIVEEEFEAAGERASKELGDSFGDKYRLAKQAYGDLRTAEKIVTKEVARGGANRAISLTDTIAAGAGFATGGVAGVAMGAGNKLMRTYGNQAAADMMNRASRLQLLQRASEQVNGQITSGVRGFLSGAKNTERVAAPKVTAATVAAIREATRDPGAFTDKVAAMLGGRGLSEAAPKTSQAIATTTMRVAAYLRDKAPKEPAPTGASFVPQRARTGSAIEQAKFAEAVEVANNPISVVDDLRRGRVSREKVEALKACYPQLYQQIRAEIASQAVEMRPKLSQQHEVAMSVLFDVPVSAIMQPQNIRAFNQSFAQGADPSQTGEAGGVQPMQPTSGVRGLNRKGSLASGFDKVGAP